MRATTQQIPAKTAAAIRSWGRPLLAVVVFAVTGPSFADKGETVVSSLPSAYGFLTLPSGDTFKFLSSGPIFGQGGERLAFAIHYVSDTTDREQLWAEAAKLLSYVRPVAESRGEKGIVIAAHLGFVPGKGASHTYNTVFTRLSSGEWRRVNQPGAVSFPKMTRPSTELMRDPAAEREATAAGSSWLSLVDDEAYWDAWDSASPLLKGYVSLDRWRTLASVWSNTFGRLRSRESRAILSTRHIDGAPVGSYVVLEYRSLFTARPSEAFEKVVVMLCEDGRWRVAGYSRSD